MIKSINGKSYNTESAKQIGYWTNGGEVSPEDQVTEALYRKRSGEYFLYGEGGPTTRYGKYSRRKGWQPGAKIIPLMKDKAMAWAKEHLSEELYNAAFSMPDTGESKMLTLLLPEQTIEKLRSLAFDMGCGMSGVIDELVQREYEEMQQADQILRQLFSRYGEFQVQRIIEEYERVKAAGEIEEVPPSLDAKCRALIRAAHEKGVIGHEEN